MKISYNWLSSYVKTDLSIEKIGTILTDTGLEVENIEKTESLKGLLKGIVVGEVLECIKHPNADKLKLTKVDLGNDVPVQIVCGAPNVEVGQKVAVATIGAILYPKNSDKIEIKKSKIRGEVSNGMICAEDELGLSNNHEGIIILDSELKPGTPLSEVYPVTEDYCIEIGLTPNRTDAMSHYGVARDLNAALKNKKMSSTFFPVNVDNFSTNKEVTNPISVEVENTDLCPRYSGIYIRNIQIKPSPEWMQNLLKTIGLTPINNVVDITNYILHSYGQPLHAFDADKIKGNKIKIGVVANGIKFITLDGTERTLSNNDLLIKDGEDTPLCIAGVYGGKDSGVTPSTTTIFLESAYFNSVSIRKTSKKHGLFTDSSFRYERGADPNATVTALKKACELLKEYADGEIIGEIIDEYPVPIKTVNTILRYHKIDYILGKRIHREQIKEILKLLDITVISETNDVLDLLIPTYRVDVTREIDVIEEVARIYGYNNIDFSEKFSFSYKKNETNYDLAYENIVADQLRANGFFEAINNSLTEKRNPNFNYVEIVNPLSKELSIMRQSLAYGLLENIAFNLNRNQKGVKLFEYGKTYFKSKQNQYSEYKKLALVLSGNYQEANWVSGSNKSTFSHLKGMVNQVLKTFNLSFINEEPIEDSEIFSDGIQLKQDKTSIGSVGIIAPALLKEFDIKTEVYYAELDWEKLISLVSKKQNYKIQEPSKFPGSNRDLALLINKEVKYIDLYKTAFETERKLLKSVNLFDVYEGENLPQDKKSYALHFFLQNTEKTITDKDIDKVMNKLIEKFKDQYNIELRT